MTMEYSNLSLLTAMPENALYPIGHVASSSAPVISFGADQDD